MALDEGGRKDEAELASGVLLRLPMMWWLPDMLSIIRSSIGVGKREKKCAAREALSGDRLNITHKELSAHSCSYLLTSKEFDAKMDGRLSHGMERKNTAAGWLGALETTEYASWSFVTYQSKCYRWERKYGVCFQANIN